MESVLMKIYEHYAGEERDMLLRAYDFAREAHRNQKRASGEPYFIHPCAVAEILVDLGLDADTIAAALLHDVIEDTGATEEDVRSLSVRFEKGRMTDFSADDETARLLSLYLQQDSEAGVLSELSIAEESNAASCMDIFAIPEWDRMRGISLTVGGPRPESLRTDEARRNANDSLVTLSIPIGSDTTVITARSADGVEHVIAEDGFIREEE